MLKERQWQKSKVFFYELSVDNVLRYILHFKVVELKDKNEILA